MATMFTSRALMSSLQRHGVQLDDTFDAVRELFARPYLPGLRASVSEEAFTHHVVAGTLSRELYEAYLLDRAVQAQRIDPTFGLDYYKDLRDLEARKMIEAQGAEIAEQLRTMIRDRAHENRQAHAALMAEGITTADAAMRHRNPEISAAWSRRLHTQEDVKRLESFLAEMITEGVVPVDQQVLEAQRAHANREVERMREALEGNKYQRPEDRDRLAGTR
jgi:hypothetical protein